MLKYTRKVKKGTMQKHDSEKIWFECFIVIIITNLSKYAIII
ncbi:hypothetical protein HMPREF0557_02975 [Listeria innocua ATCC 33091]|uniref:Uncharacterized protein n=1 Tax=Listeria innocua ATCC 33091 TaxID=1002366 RepID=A0AB72Z4Q3_LISIO|nr:hypothetical protein HMPREF0557_02975 [Listeria innocua ATCC 33091]